MKSTTFGRSDRSVLPNAFVTSAPVGGRPGAATSEVESAVSALRLRGFCWRILGRVDDLASRICDS